MKHSRRLLPLLLLPLVVVALAAPSAADDPPEVDFQPANCTVPGKAIRLCADVRDDVGVGKARVYFRPLRDKYFSYVDMEFAGLQFCATLPAPREGKLKAVEYYLQAVDTGYQTRRTSTYQLPVQADAVCGFPPVETDAARAAAITVYATHKKQGSKLPDEFERAGVNFVPFGR